MYKKIYTEEFISKSIIKHGKKYDYSSVLYINSFIPVIIYCKVHGFFTQEPRVHLRGNGCSKCAGVKKLTNIEFINKAMKIHPDLYIYDKVNYNGNDSNIEIICKKHGIFLQKPRVHLRGSGCNRCKSNKSKGVLKIKEILEKNGIYYREEHTFPDLKNVRLLRFDFILYNNGVLYSLIEFNGKQHYTTNSFPRSKKQIQIDIDNDRLKIEYCKNKKIQLIVIKHDDDIDKILGDYLFNSIFSLAQQCKDVQ